MSPGSVTTPPWYHLGQEETGESRGERIKSESPPKEKVPEKTTSGTRLDSFFFSSAMQWKSGVGLERKVV